MMYLELDDKLKNKIENITNIDYEFKGNFLPNEKIISIFEDLICEIESLNEKFEDFKKDVEYNYKRISEDETY